MQNIDKIKRFTVISEYPNNSYTYTFTTLKEAKLKFKKEKDLLIYESKQLEDRHWRNNQEGLSVELKELRYLPQDLIDNINDSNDENDLIREAIFTYSTTIKTSITFMEHKYNLRTHKSYGKLIQINNTLPLYSTIAFDKECVYLKTKEKTIAKGCVQIL